MTRRFTRPNRTGRYAAFCGKWKGAGLPFLGKTRALAIYVKKV